MCVGVGWWVGGWAGGCGGGGVPGTGLVRQAPRLDARAPESVLGMCLVSPTEQPPPHPTHMRPSRPCRALYPWPLSTHSHSSHWLYVGEMEAARRRLTGTHRHAQVLQVTTHMHMHMCKVVLGALLTSIIARACTVDATCHAMLSGAPCTVAQRL